MCLLCPRTMRASSLSLAAGSVWLVIFPPVALAAAVLTTVSPARPAGAYRTDTPTAAPAASGNTTYAPDTWFTATK